MPTSVRRREQLVIWGSCFSDSLLGWVIHSGPRPIDVVGPLELGQQDLVQTFPDPGGLPLLRIMQAGYATTAAHLLRKVLPRNTGFQHEHEPVKTWRGYKGLRLG
jgi:hypothetical protein